MTPSLQLLAERDRALQAGQYGEEDLERLVGVLDSVMEQLHRQKELLSQARHLLHGSWRRGDEWNDRFDDWLRAYEGSAP